MKNVLICVFSALCFINIYGLSLRNKEPQFKDIPRETVEVPQEEIKKEEQKPNITVLDPTTAIAFEDIYTKLLTSGTKRLLRLQRLGLLEHHTKIIQSNIFGLGRNWPSKVMIMATIHGNEKLCTMTALGCMNKLLKEYMVDEVYQVVKDEGHLLCPRCFS